MSILFESSKVKPSPNGEVVNNTFKIFLINVKLFALNTALALHQLGLLF